MSSFQKDTISLDAVPDSRVALPDSSTQLKVYFDGNILKQLDFAGKVTPILPVNQQIKIIDAKVNKDVSDVSKFTFRIPNLTKKIADLNDIVSKINTEVSSFASSFASSSEVALLVSKINESIITLENEIKLVDIATQEALIAANEYTSVVASDVTLLSGRMATSEQL